MGTREMPQARDELDDRATSSADALLDELSELLGGKEFADVSVKDIASGAGVPVGRFYSHYPTKVDALRALVDREASERRAAFRDAPPDQTLDELIAFFVDRFIELYRAPPPGFRAHAVGAATDDLVRADRSAYLRSSSQVWRNHLTARAEAIRHHDPGRAAETAFWLVTAVLDQRLLLDWPPYLQPCSDDELAERLAALVRWVFGEDVNAAEFTMRYSTESPASTFHFPTDLPRSKRAKVRQARSPEGEETFDRFVSAMASLLEEKTFREITMAEILERADRPVGSFYSLFSDKNALLAVLTERNFAVVAQRLEGLWDPEIAATTPLPLLVRGALSNFVTFYRDPHFHAEAHVSLSPRDPELRRLRAKRHETLLGLRQRALLTHEDDFGAVPVLDASATVFWLTAAVMEHEAVFGSTFGELLRPSADVADDLTHLANWIYSIDDTAPGH